MKATGIVRKIDDLGRVVIPKEIRKNLHIHEGDPLEIFIEQKGQIILKKYAPMGDILELSGQFAEILNDITGLLVCITDLETVIAVSGKSKSDYLAKEISEEVIDVMKSRKILSTSENRFSNIPILMDENGDKYKSQLVAPIISNADAIGTVILLSLDNKKITITEYKLAESVAKFLAKQME